MFVIIALIIIILLLFVVVLCCFSFILVMCDDKLIDCGRQPIKQRIEDSLKCFCYYNTCTVKQKYQQFLWKRERLLYLPNYIN